MKPAPFGYARATDADHAVQLLSEHGPQARLLAGGQSLVPMLNYRQSRPTMLVDLNRAAGLDYVRVDGDSVVIGAMTRHRTLETSAEVARTVPLLAEALGFVGHVANRHRGTIGGSLAHADPAAELPAVLTALDGEVTVVGPTGTRTVRAAGLFERPFTTTLDAGELLTAVRLPVLHPGTGVAVAELALRYNELALVAAMAAITLGPDGRVVAARLSVAGANPVPLRLAASEEVLVGAVPTPDVVQAAGAAAAEAVSPAGDRHASADYRREMTELFVVRAVTRATRPAEERAA